MQIKKQIDSCIKSIRKMLADPSNELTSGQRRILAKGISDLKCLRKAKRLTYDEVQSVVSQIAEAVIECLEPGTGA